MKDFRKAGGNDGGRSLLERYNSLAVTDQTVLQALSVLYEPASARVVSSCLCGAGCRENPDRTFLPQNTAIRLSRLAKEGLAGVETRQGAKGAFPVWTCAPGISETAIRHAVRDGMFARLSRAALAETRGRDWHEEGSGESSARNLRIHFHARDEKQTEREFLAMEAERPGSGSALLAVAMADPATPSWTSSLPGPFLDLCLRLCLGNAFSSLADVGGLPSLAERRLCPDQSPNHRLLEVLAEDLILRGDVERAEKLPPARLEATRERIASGLALASGNDAEAEERASRFLALRRRQDGQRMLLPPGWPAVWRVLALLRLNDRPALAELSPALESPEAKRHEFAGALACLGYAASFCLGRLSGAREIPPAAGDIESRPLPMTVFLHALATSWIAPERIPSLEAGLRDLGERARRAGYLWLVRQANDLLPAEARIRVPKKVAALPSLAGALARQTEWRRALSALAACSGGEDGEEGEKSASKRLAWLLRFSGGGDGDVETQPIEQTAGKSGGWSKGRPVALKRIFHHGDQLSFAGEQDRKVFSALSYDWKTWPHGFSFDHRRALSLLAGHPLVFRADSPGTRVDVVAGDVELTVLEQDGGCEISLSPPPSELAAGFSGSEAGKLPDVVVREETPTRIKVFGITPLHRSLASIIGEGLAVPEEGKTEALEALSALAGKIRVHSGVGGFAETAETSPADAAPRFHIVPRDGGMAVELWMHPFGDSGPAYRPGEGGKTVFAEIGGKRMQTLRSLEGEREAARSAVGACPSLGGCESGPLSWRLDRPDLSLSFLLEAQELGERAVLVWPKGGRFRVRSVPGAGNLSLRLEKRDDWFEVSGSLAVDEDTVIDMRRLLEASSRAAGRFIPLGDGDFLALTESLQARLRDLESFGEEDGGRFLLHRLGAGALERMEEMGVGVEAGAFWREFLERRRRAADFRPPLPPGLRAELRDYQVEGFRWLAGLAEWGAGACLADDMGLGKTVQALAVLLHRARLGPALAVAPTSVCHNWLAEARRFAPSLRAAIFGEGDREGLLKALGPNDLVISSYGLLQQEEPLLAGVEWATVVLDEAQAIKNTATKRSKAAMSLTGGFRLITTGTPIENHLGELWNLFNFINPRLLGKWPRFQERFANPVERFGDQEAGRRLKRLIQPFILRRTKSQVLDTLPPKTEIVLSVEMGREERAFYEALRRQAVERLDGDGGPVEERRFRILAEIMRLRRACCNPSLVAADAPPPSAKFEQFKESMAELMENGHKVLVFSQFVDHLSILRRHLDGEGVAYQYLDGSTPAKKRKRAVEDFQAGKGDAFLISLRAGGLGLNLAAADYVMHMDPWWNPAVEDQASDRAHRIGQTRPVTVYRLIAKDTIEEKIVDLHRRKRDLADTLLSGTGQAAKVDLEEILRLLRDEP